ncbi:MAG: hypothetical protein CMO06_04720 [Thalassospira sp.]|nr:hypothetical protein [Thalassospira sp.]
MPKRVPLSWTYFSESTETGAFCGRLQDATDIIYMVTHANRQSRYIAPRNKVLFSTFGKSVTLRATKRRKVA